MPEKAFTPSEGSRIPIWVLTPAEEKCARANLKTSAYKHCNEYVRELVECSKKYGLTVFPNCNPEKEKFKECLLSYQTEVNFDNERDKIISSKIEKLEKQIKEHKGAEKK